MEIQKKERYSLVTPTENSFVDFFNAFSEKLSTLANEHIVIDFLKTFDVTVEELEKFSDISITKKENGTSFVLISDTVDIDAFEDESLSIVPTHQEAEDILEMDAIERDLGF